MNKAYKIFLQYSILPQFENVGIFQKWITEKQMEGPRYIEVFKTSLGTFLLYGADYIGGDKGVENVKEIIKDEGFVIEKSISLQEYKNQHVYSNKTNALPYKYVQYEDDEDVLCKLNSIE